MPTEERLTCHGEKQGPGLDSRKSGRSAGLRKKKWMLLVYNSHGDDFLKTWVVCYVFIVAKDWAGEGCSV